MAEGGGGGNAFTPRQAARFARATARGRGRRR